MKKIVLALMAAMMMTGVVTAQETKKERKQISQTEMIKHRTDRMVKQYGLDDGQAAKLLELNTKYAKSLPGGGMGPRGRKGSRLDANGQQPTGSKPEGEPKDMKEGRNQKGQRPDFEKMKKTMDEYDTQLKGILSDKQYQSYKADMEKMRQRGPRGERDNTKTTR